jgi:hypothetical protein
MLPAASFLDVNDPNSAGKPDRQASTQYILLDSQDRNQLGNQSFQPWNNFSFQKPQAILDAFANRILVSEVYFPWFVPNITTFNNTMELNAGEILTVPQGFYTPAQLVAALNAQLLTFGYTTSAFSYNSLTMQYSLSTGASDIIGINFSTAIPQPNFTTTASLFKTMGFILPQDGTTVLQNQTLTGIPTQTLYTPYVDIVSNRLMRYTAVKDGESAANAQSALICRIYASDETSTTNIVNGVPITCSPFVIHRQYKNAKAVLWNKDAFVDYFDIQVVDQYNNLVPLPTVVYQPSTGASTTGSYPDFQITLLASED